MIMTMSRPFSFLLSICHEEQVFIWKGRNYNCDNRFCFRLLIFAGSFYVQEICINYFRKRGLFMSEKQVMSFGYDIGITSIGSAAVEGTKLKYLGVRMFNQANEAKESRMHRSARRNLSRKKWRKKQLKEAFEDFGLISKEEMNQKDFSCFPAKSALFPTPSDYTVYHLRKRALSGKVSLREIYLCLLNMLHARGHFNMEMYDFTKETIKFDTFRERFYAIAEEYIPFIENEKQKFEEELLLPLYKGECNKALIRQIKKNHFTDDEDALTELMNLLCGYKSNLVKISEAFEAQGKMNISSLRSSDEGLPDFLEECVDLFDMAKISQILKKYSYLCDMAVDKIDEYEEIVRKYGIQSKEYEEYCKQIRNISGGNPNHARSWRNLNNNYPNGLYIKEASAILRKQQEYYPGITDDFIEVCLSILSARIPYYIGPMSETGKNAWITRNDKVAMKYSFAYAQKSSGGTAVDEEASISTWKQRMVSRCTYLPEEPALPKGSFLAETFNILNELNILKAEDEHGGSYYLTFDDKVKVFDELFLKKEKVTYKDVAECLNLSAFGPRKTGTKEPEFNNTFTLYHRISKIIPDLAVSTIMEIFDEPEKIQKIEDIILSVNLYSEEISRENYFRKTGFDDTSARQLAKLKSNSFYSFSRKFIFATVIDSENNTLLSKLFSDNSSEYTNEQMTLITRATDTEGNPVNFISNKYVRKLQENNGSLGINLLIDNGKPVIAMSRPVIRALNECMKVYSEMIRVYGVPDRVVVETARDFKDHTEVGQKSERRFKKLEDLYANLINQVKDKKIYDNHLEDWDDIKQYLERNSLKIELYLRQNGIDLLTGERINLNKLSDYEVDHILPRGFGDDSKDDKMLISRLANGRKGDRLPLQFIESGEAVGTIKITSSEYVRRVEELFANELISEQKYKRLLLANESELDGFINQNLVDTRYIIREFMSILRAYNEYHGYKTHIVALKSAYTNTYRKAFDMKKNRDFGDQHHAHDAALLVIADRTLSKLYPGYDMRKASKETGKAFATYQDFIRVMLDSKKNSEGAKEDRNKLNAFINYAYYKTFDESASLPGSLLSQIKKTVPFYSVKVEKNYKGKYFEATILSQEKYADPTKPLAIIGVNDDKKIFSGIECAAVDFYKIKTKKGKREHVAIHIPKVIIDSKGNINQENYLKLIREYYKKPELLDENGNLKTECFRFRAFRNDIIYDTASNCPKLFNIGSMANNLLEMKFLKVYSYDEIYQRGSMIQNRLTQQFNIRTKSNKSGNFFKDLNIEKLVHYTVESIWGPYSEMDGAKLKTLIKNVKESNRIFDLANVLSFYELFTMNPGLPPTITGQYMPSINYRLIKGDEDAQYVKLKYNILGLRFSHNSDGKLMIDSPKEIQGAYSKIRKEEFSWSISKEML